MSALLTPHGQRGTMLLPKWPHNHVSKLTKKLHSHGSDIMKCNIEETCAMKVERDSVQDISNWKIQFAFMAELKRKTQT